MAFGFGNTTTLTLGNWSTLTGTTAQQIGGLNWDAAVGDITPIGQADDLLRTKVVSARHNQGEVSIPYFMDLATMSPPPSSGSTASGLLTINPAGDTSTTITHTVGITHFEYGGFIDDEVSVGEIRVIPIGGVALDGF